MYYKKSDYNLINIQKSDRKEKKYTAVIQHKKGKIKYIHFGAIKQDGTPYQQYRDSTKLKLYKKFDHGDKMRRKNYRARAKGKVKEGYYSAGDFAMRFLWT
jgi:hypothetical protein